MFGFLSDIFGQKETTPKTLHCPVCRGDEFLEGPSGGLAVNLKCTSCETEIWWGGPFGAEIIKSSEISEECGFKTGDKFKENKLFW